MKHKASLGDRIWKDKDGNVVLTHSPNLPIVVWFAALIIAKLVPEGDWQSAASLISFGALFTWAWLELFWGVNYFRRGLGAVILILSIWTRL